MRKTLEETWLYLETMLACVPRHADGSPAVLRRMPSFDDDEPRLSFYGTGLEDADYRSLTMPRTFFGRSLFERVSFVDTDLSESRVCWNDFIDCDFTQADLSGCDLRASSFVRCSFAGAVLRGADLRRSHIDNCDFDGADLSGAKAAHVSHWKSLRARLSSDQVSAMSWAKDAGPEPDGG